MAKLNTTPHDFIRYAFRPNVAVFASTTADACCRKNNLSLVDLLQPFAKLNTKVHYRDPSGIQITIPDLSIQFCDINWKPPHTSVSREYLNMCVKEFTEPRKEPLIIDNHRLMVTTKTPWFETWRELFLQLLEPSEHEYTKHFIACLVIVSTSETNPYDTTVEMAQRIHQTYTSQPNKLPKWFSQTITKYFVFIHDNVDGPKDMAMQSFEMIKKDFGEKNTFMLRINSSSFGQHLIQQYTNPLFRFTENRSIEFKVRTRSAISVSPTVSSPLTEKRNSPLQHPLSPVASDSNTSFDHASGVGGRSSSPSGSPSHSSGTYLSNEDIEQVKQLVREFCQNCLVPYVECQMVQLHEAVTNKKVSRSLFSATKRWFSPNKLGSTSSTNLMYPLDAPELQTRRLADLCFMFNHYSLAFQMYQMAKRDFNADQAWLYYAGALEMAGLAAFMSNDSSRKMFEYMEEGINTYLNPCGLQQFATRATLLSYECLASHKMLADAAVQLIRMVDKKLDLHSALFLEQAAYCFLFTHMRRKFAFHMVLAGHRFNKASQTKHSLRCYKQAQQVFKNTGWKLAEDHIYFIIGRQAHALHMYNEAVESLGILLSGYNCRQNKQQQQMYLMEYLTILGDQVSNEEKRPDSFYPALLLPKVLPDSIRLLMEPTLPLKTPGRIAAKGQQLFDKLLPADEAEWHNLERSIMQYIYPNTAGIFRPKITLYDRRHIQNTSVTIEAIAKEPIQMHMDVKNPLHVPVHMRDVHLLWSYSAEPSGSDGHNAQHPIIGNVTHSPVRHSSEISHTNVKHMDMYAKTHIVKSTVLPYACQQPLTVTITPLIEGYISLIGICYTLHGTAPNVNNPLSVRGKQLLIPSLSKEALQVHILPQTACLEVTFSELNSEQLLCNEIQIVTMYVRNAGLVPVQNIYVATPIADMVLMWLCDEPSQCSMGEQVVKMPITAETPLKPDECRSTVILLKAANYANPCHIRLLIYYEGIDTKRKPRYRLVRHEWKFAVREALQIVGVKCMVDRVNKASQDSTETTAELNVIMNLQNNLDICYGSYEIRITRVSLRSNCWTLRCDERDKEIGSARSTADIRLTGNQSSDLLLNLKCCLTDPSSHKTMGTVCGVMDPLPCISSCVLMPCGRPTMKDAKTNVEQPAADDGKPSSYRLANSRLMERDHGSQAKAVPVVVLNDGVFFVEWEATATGPDACNIGSTTLFGQTELLLDTMPGCQRLCTPPPLHCQFFHQNIIRHDFNLCKFVIIPVRIIVHNLDLKQSVRFTISTADIVDGSHLEAKDPLDRLRPYSSDTCITTHFVLVGCNRIVRQLRPSSTECVHVQVAVSKPGCFDVCSRLRMAYCTDTMQDKPEPYLIPKNQSSIFAVVQA